MFAHMMDNTGQIVAIGSVLGEPTEEGVALVELTPEQEAALTPVPPGNLYLEADGTITVVPPGPQLPTYDQRETEESRSALRYAPDDATKIAILSEMTIGVVS